MQDIKRGVAEVVCKGSDCSCEEVEATGLVLVFCSCNGGSSNSTDTVEQQN